MIAPTLAGESRHFPSYRVFKAWFREMNRAGLVKFDTIMAIELEGVTYTTPIDVFEAHEE